MSGLKERFERASVHFAPGGRWSRYHALFEMVDTFVFAVNDRTVMAPHVRAAIDMKRVMTYVVLATIPAIWMGWYNTGFQIHRAMETLQLTSTGEWRGALMSLLGLTFDSNSIVLNIIHGMLYFFPIYIVTLAVGGVCEVLFAMIRKHEVNEGFLVSSMLYTLAMPPGTPLWQVGLGIAFGIVFGKEIFGGTGKNFMNPALVGRAFLYFAYPAYMTGDRVWIPIPNAYNGTAQAGVEAFSGQTALVFAGSGGYESLEAKGFSWLDSFIGVIPGSIGETSTLAILLGVVFLMVTRIANYRLVLGMLLGVVVTSYLFNIFGAKAYPLGSMPWYWHMVIGSLAFGMAFMVTEPVSAASTQTGRWIYAFLVGAMTIVLRVANPAYPEGVMLAILFGNVFAPIIDYGVLKMTVRRRRRRIAAFSSQGSSS